MLNKDLPLLVAIARVQHPELGGRRTDELVKELREAESREVANVLLKKDVSVKSRQKYAAELEAIKRLAGTR